MNKDLIELQKGSPATAVVVFDSDISQLENKVILEVENKKNISKATLNFVSNKLSVLSSQADIMYVVIRNIAGLDEILQESLIGLIKDRVMMGLSLPENCIIVFTIKDKTELKNIPQEIYKHIIEC